MELSYKKIKAKGLLAIGAILLSISTISSLNIGVEDVQGADSGLTLPPKYKQPTKEAVLPDKLRKQYDKAIEYGKKGLVKPTPYVFGGANIEKGIDCSGFVWQAYKNAGIEGVPSTRYTTDSLLHGSYRITDPSPGDLVMFYGTYNSGYTNGVSHVALYLGNGKILQASGGNVKGKVNISPIDNGYWTTKKPDFRRLKQLHSDKYDSVKATSDYSDKSSGATSSDTATATSDKDVSTNKSSKYTDWNPFVKREVGIQGVGVDNGTSIMPSELSNVVYIGINIISKICTYAMVLLVLVLAIMLSIQILVLAILHNRGAINSQILMKMESFVYGKNTYENAYMKKILINFGIIVVLIFFTMSGYYIISMTNIYSGLATIVSIFQEWVQNILG